MIAEYGNLKDLMATLPREPSEVDEDAVILDFEEILALLRLAPESSDPDASIKIGYVVLTLPEIARAKKIMPLHELAYWVEELHMYAVQNVKEWRKKYARHSLVIRVWRNRKHEKGMVWDKGACRYTYPRRNFIEDRNQTSVLEERDRVASGKTLLTLVKEKARG